MVKIHMNKQTIKIPEYATKQCKLFKDGVKGLVPLKYTNYFGTQTM